MPSTEPRTRGQGPRLTVRASGNPRTGRGHRRHGKPGPLLLTGPTASPSCPFHSTNQTQRGGKDQRDSPCPEGNNGKNRDLVTVMLRKDTNQPDPGNQASGGFDVNRPLFPRPPKDHSHPGERSRCLGCLRFIQGSDSGTLPSDMEIESSEDITI